MTQTARTVLRPRFSHLRPANPKLRGMRPHFGQTGQRHMFWFTWEVHIGKEIGTQSPGSVGRVGVSAGGLGTFGGKLHGPSGPILCGLLWPILHRLLWPILHRLSGPIFCGLSRPILHRPLGPTLHRPLWPKLSAAGLRQVPSDFNFQDSTFHVKSPSLLVFKGPIQLYFS